MIQKHVTGLLPEYLDKLLDDIQNRSVEKHLKECDVCTKELEDLKIILKAFEKEEPIIPSATVRTNFYQQLEQEKQNNPKVVALDMKSSSQKNPWVTNLLKIAASIALLIASFMLGKQQQEQKSNTEIAVLMDEALNVKQTAMLSLMGNKSASKRIQGVNYIDEFMDPDEAIVEALADRMLLDENANVRLTAVAALEKFTTSETVKNTFIRALKIEKDPGIQIAIIQTLVKIQEKKAIGAMQYLLEQDDTQPYVKEQLKLVLPNII